MKAAKQTGSAAIPAHQVLWFGLGIAALLLAAPLYTPLTVFLASHFQHFDLFKILKEMLLAILSVGAVALLVAKPKLRAQVFKNKLLVVMLTYVLLTLGWAIFDLATDRVTTSAVIFGLIINLRFIIFFGVVYTAILSAKNFKLPWQKLVFIPAVLVIGFGLLQQFVLPSNFLSHVGYNKVTTYEPFETVDNHPNIVRVQSSLRGPNPLGAYLLVVVCIIAVLALQAKGRQRQLLLVLGFAALVVLFGTYSRSAWLGLMASGIGLVVLAAPSKLATKQVWIGGIAALLIVLAAFAWLRNTYQFQNIIFHTSNKSPSSISSNEKRFNALESGSTYVLKHPLGGGVGSSGPASTRNQKAPSRLSENYYLQIGEEVGWLGLGLFVAIQVLLALQLWVRRADPLTLALLVSLIGLVFVNLVSHAWADDTLAYVWWGLTALVVAQPVKLKR